MASILTSNPMVALPPPADLAIAIGGAMTVDEFCRWACVGRTKLYSEIKCGRITPRKLGSKTVILQSEAERWLHALPTAAEIEDKSLADACDITRARDGSLVDGLA